jgi:sigma-B regulation protein RsbU (phosphoserine phosphatase)
LDALAFRIPGYPPRFFLCALLLAILCGGTLLTAQNPADQHSAMWELDATRLREPVGLDAPWRVLGGDDPAYARPEFDDSQWQVFDPYGDIHKLFPHNHPDVIWYRQRIKVDPTSTDVKVDPGAANGRVDPAPAQLALQENSISRAFEIYVNGELFIATGQISPFAPYTWSQLIVRRIPERLLKTGTLTIAARVHISRHEWTDTRPGLDDGNLLIGQEGTLRQQDWLEIIGSHSAKWLDNLLMIALGLVALVLFAAQRRQTEYLWIAALGLTMLAESIEPLVAAFHNIPLIWEGLYDCIRVVTPYLWVCMYFSIIHKRVTWRWSAILVLAGLLNAFSGVQSLYLTLPVIVQFFSNILFIILLSVVIPILLAVYWRRGNREAGILLIPAVLFSLYIYAEVGFEVLYQFPGQQDAAMRGLNFIDRYPLGPFYISLDNVSSVLSTLALAIIILLRSTRMSRRQAILESELAAAQQVQQVLVPEQTESVPGFDVESVYLPAQQVGGDFFQVMPTDNNGLLVVVGDVAGKGLPAAMLVSVLVGAIRGVAEYTTDPAEMLGSLNERLVGRGGGGFSTALVAHITREGWVTIANAGHLSPYLDGDELKIAGALPLGVISGNKYETTPFYLPHGSRLTFYSDGVVEAQNADRELLGFERAKELSTEPAATIVEAARLFGQEDDITVVTITRHVALATAA